jgi:hypothetical protein
LWVFCGLGGGDAPPDVPLPEDVLLGGALLGDALLGDTVLEATLPLVP